MKLEYTVVVLGAGDSGKTSMISQFIHGLFPDKYTPTVEDCHRHVIQMPDGLFYGVEILDTAGSHQFPAMRDLNIKKGQAFVLVFAINDIKSFQEAMRLGQQIVDTKGEDFPLVLVGNKQDLSDERCVTYDEAVCFARDTLRCTYLETSAKLNFNIYDLFLELIMRALNIDEPPASPVKKDLVISNNKSSHKIPKLLKRNSADGGVRSQVKIPDHQKCPIL